MPINANSTKCANVSYSLNKIRKSIYVPQINQEFEFGSNMTDPVWRDAAKIEDFAPFAPADKKEFAKSTLLLFRTHSFLVLGWFFAITEADRLYPAETANPSPWHGDLAELHFGSTGPDPSLLQLAVGITGLTFDSSGSNLWQAHTFENADGWGAEYTGFLPAYHRRRHRFQLLPLRYEKRRIPVLESAAQAFSRSGKFRRTAL